MSDCGCEIEVTDKEQTKTLIILMAINGVMFLLEIGIGWYAQSTALIADALDMLADSLVYAIGLYAIGKALTAKAQAATISGVLQGLLALSVVVDIILKVLHGSEPVSWLMMGMGTVALIANVICLQIISRHREGEVHMRASWIFSKNDVIANCGVILGGLLVWQFDTAWPDIAIGCILVLVIFRGAILILKDARETLNSINTESTCGG